jgi:hypothetical protein
MPYFPLIVVFCKRYVSNAGIGTLVAMMLPYSVVFLVAWSAFLLIYWHPVGYFRSASSRATSSPLGDQSHHNPFSSQAVRTPAWASRSAVSWRPVSA